MMKTIKYTPIGVIHSPFETVEHAPRQAQPVRGAGGRIELLAGYQKGLRDLEGFSHIVLVYHLHRARGYSLEVKPPLDAATHGVFATRSPRRPNPIGISVVRLERIVGRTLYVRDVDVVDGTPLLDIKPHIPDLEPTADIDIGWLSGRRERDRGRHSRGTQAPLIRQIATLKRERNALIVAHNYQRAEVQEVADFTGDSLELSVVAERASQSVIVFCGVRFMAETAAILCPDKTILLPVLEAGCALADTATARQVRAARERYPGAVVVAYVNTSSEVKAESDICCTSANALQVIRSIDAVSPIIFVSDRHLGSYASKLARREVVLWEGSCPTHSALLASDLRRARQQYPEAEVMVHPECRPEVVDLADHVAGTAGMLAHAKSRPQGTSFVVGTERGLLHRLKKENSDKTFHPAAEHLVCPTMKLTALEDVGRALERKQHIITVGDPVRDKARASLAAMFAR